MYCLEIPVFRILSNFLHEWYPLCLGAASNQKRHCIDLWPWYLTLTSDLDPWPWSLTLTLTSDLDLVTTKLSENSPFFQFLMKNDLSRLFFLCLLATSRCSVRHFVNLSSWGGSSVHCLEIPDFRNYFLNNWHRWCSTKNGNLLKWNLSTHFFVAGHGTRALSKFPWFSQF